MTTLSFPHISVCTLLLIVAGCDATVPRRGQPQAAAPVPPTESAMSHPLIASEHRGSDDLLSAGLGLEGLRALIPPAFAQAEAPTPAELRRRTIWTNWRGIADLAAGGGYGSVYAAIPSVPGREFRALAQLPGASQPHRVLTQIPDSFDARKRCLIVTASSGSRGIYGAIAVAGAWGLPKGCAVAYTDKGAGTDYFDLSAGRGVREDGSIGSRSDALAFAPDSAATSGIAFKHAHSTDNPEADWGRHVKQAAEFGLRALDEAYPQQAPFTFANTRVIGVGISNGGGAVLRAAELDGDWLAGVVAGAPNIYTAGPGARSLYDYTTEASLLMACALPQLGIPAVPDVAQRCAQLAAARVISGADTAAQQASAYAALRASGWSDEALRAGAISVGFNLWHAVGVTYASAYGRYRAGEEPCGYRFAALAPDRSARPPTAAERAAWWADGSGIPPGAGLAIIDPPTGDALSNLQCLRALWTGKDADAQRVQQGIAATRAGVVRAGLPIIVVHGLADGLIPAAFSSAPYVAAATAAGRDVRYWQVPHVQHFDAFLGLPQYAAQYLPLLAYVYGALDRLWAHLDQAAPLPASATIASTPRGAGEALQASHLALPP